MENQILEYGISLTVPLNAPLGDYTFTTYIGLSPDDIWDSDSFGFSVEGFPVYSVYDSIGVEDFEAVW